MTIYDLLFIFVVLTTIGVLFAMGFLFVSGQRDKTWSVLRYLSAGWVAYMTLVVTVSTSMPQRVLTAGEARCFDDWCLTILNAKPVNAEQVNVRLLIASRARRVFQREKGIRLSMVDNSGRRYGGISNCRGARLDAMLGPGEQRQTNCFFEFPNPPKQVSVLIEHADGFPIRWFIVGEEAWFRKPTIVRLPLGKITDG
jgi:hypothetical protein